MVLLLRVVAAAFVALAAGAGISATQTVDDIVARNLDARGGVERLRAIDTVKITAKLTSQGMELPMTSWAKRPNLIRRDTKFQNQTIVLAFDGSRVWGIDPLAGPGAPLEITGPQADMMREEAEFDSLFLDYRDKGHTIDLIGRETLEGRDVHHLRVERKNGQVQHYYLDAASGLEVRIVTILEQGGMTAEIANDLADYREIDGLRVPFRMKQSLNGTPRAQVTLENVEFNVPIDHDFFRMKKGAPRTGGGTDADKG